MPMKQKRFKKPSDQVRRVSNRATNCAIAASVTMECKTKQCAMCNVLCALHWGFDGSHTITTAHALTTKPTGTLKYDATKHPQDNQ